MLMFPPFQMFDMEEIGEKDEKNFHENHQCRKGIDFRGNTPFDHGVNVEGKSGGIRTGDEKADDKIVDGKRKGNQCAGNDTGHDEGERHIAETLPGLCIQIARRFFVFRFHTFQAGTYRNDHKGEAKRDMRKNNRRFS